MKKLYLGAFFLYAISTVKGQEVLWEKEIQTPSQSFLSQITTTIDQQILISGSIINPNGSTNQKLNDGYDYHIEKFNQQGERLWEKSFSGKKHDILTATICTQEGGFILAGTSYSSKGADKKELNKGGSDIWVIRINEFGEEIWQRTIGTNKSDEAKAVIQTLDLGFLIGGNVHNLNNGFGSKDVVLTKLDKDGKEIYQLVLGGKSIDSLEKMIPTKDGGALLGIYSRSSNSPKRENYTSISTDSNLPPLSYKAKNTENYGNGDYWIVKVNKEGNVEWEKNFGGDGDDHIKTLALSSTGYIIGGETTSKKSGNKKSDLEYGTDLWILSLDEKGNEIWQTNISFKNRDFLMGMSVINSSNDKLSKGILIGGYTQKEEISKENDETFWMLYMDHSGKEIWRKYVEGESKKRLERLSDIKLNKDGSIVIAGSTSDFLGKENWKILKLKDSSLEQYIEKSNIKIYPNPVSEYTYVEIGFDFEEADISIYDMSGRELQSLKTKNKITKIITQNLIQGAYLVVVKTNTNSTSAKIIKK